VWSLLTAPAGLALWLGTLDRLPAEPGEGYRTAEGTTGSCAADVRSTGCG
jgi:uncharacterized protein YndB with AHSA1/START domain